MTKQQPMVKTQDSVTTKEDNVKAYHDCIASHGGVDDNWAEKDLCTVVCRDGTRIHSNTITGQWWLL